MSLRYFCEWTALSSQTLDDRVHCTGGRGGLTATTKPPRTMYAREGPVTCGYILGEFVSGFRYEVLYGLPLTPDPSPFLLSFSDTDDSERVLREEVQVRSQRKATMGASNFGN